MEEALVKRVLPHSVEAEQSVIGSMLMAMVIYPIAYAPETASRKKYTGTFDF